MHSNSVDAGAATAGQGGVGGEGGGEKHRWQRQQQREGEPKQHQQPRIELVREKPTTCGFCAKRKKRCDGLLLRYGLCTDQNRPRRQNRQDQTTMFKSNVVAASRLKCFSGARHSGKPVPTSMDTMKTQHGRMALGFSNVLPLKRCRLSPSPATGLVGTQENAFLNDFFGCFGFLPLASARIHFGCVGACVTEVNEARQVSHSRRDASRLRLVGLPCGVPEAVDQCTSMARQAMVNIMLAPKLLERQHKHGSAAGNLKRGERKGVPKQRTDRGREIGLTDQDRIGSPSRCILWSGIALGALLKGSPLSFVAGYVKLAQDSLAECFDGTTVETARAYLAMAFLCRFLGDQEKNKEYVAFAGSIVDRLPQEAVPSDMENMLLVWEEEYRLINYHSGDSGVPVKQTVIEEGINHALTVRGVVNEEGLCNIILLADRRMNRCIRQRMDDEGTPENIKEEGQEREVTGKPDEGVRSTSWMFQENVELGEVEGVRSEVTKGLTETRQPNVRANDAIWSPEHRAVLPSRVATETLISDVLPELEGISRVIQRSGICSGVGGIFYHSVMAYTNIVKGERRTAFQSIRVCTRVMSEFPGICRYRPHMVHCVLLALASTRCPVMYDPMREVYNSILPENGPPAPPLEEWGGMSGICNNAFCRSFEISTNYVGFGPGNVKFDRGRAAPRDSPAAPLVDPEVHSVAEGTHGWSTCLACGAHASYLSASRAGTRLEQQLYADDDVGLPSATHAQPCWSNHTVEVASGGEIQTDAIASAVPYDSLGREGICGGRHYDTGSVGTDCGRSVERLERWNEVIDVDLQKGFLAEATSEIPRPMTKVPAVPADLGDVHVRDSVSCDNRVGNIEVPNRADDLAAVNDLTGCDLRLYDDGQNGPDLCLSEDYLMNAVEALMTSAPIDGEIQEETVGWI